VQAAATHDLNGKLKDHISNTKRLFRGVNRAIDRVAKLKATPGPQGPKGPQGVFASAFERRFVLILALCPRSSRQNWSHRPSW
jgi:hypothetical protein